jgi:hypothetical protein
MIQRQPWLKVSKIPYPIAKPDMMVCGYNFSCTGGGRRIMVQGLPQAKMWTLLEK